MQKIEVFLEKFRGIKIANEDLIQQVQGNFLKHIGTRLDKENIIISNNKVFIKASPIEKSEFLLKEKEFISDLEKSLLRKAPKFR